MTDPKPIPFSGTECPVPGPVRVKVQYRDAHFNTWSIATWIHWPSVTAYEIHPEDLHMIEPKPDLSNPDMVIWLKQSDAFKAAMQAHVKAGGKVEFLYRDGTWCGCSDPFVVGWNYRAVPPYRPLPVEPDPVDELIAAVEGALTRLTYYPAIHALSAALARVKASREDGK